MASTTMTNSDKCSQRAMLSSSGHVILLDATQDRAQNANFSYVNLLDYNVKIVTICATTRVH